MKHCEIRIRTVCLIYGHGDLRWLPQEEPPPLPQGDDDRAMLLTCLLCGEIVKRST